MHWTNKDHCLENCWNASKLHDLYPTTVKSFEIKSICLLPPLFHMQDLRWRPYRGNQHCCSSQQVCYHNTRDVPLFPTTEIMQQKNPSLEMVSWPPKFSWFLHWFFFLQKDLIMSHPYHILGKSASCFPHRQQILGTQGTFFAILAGVQYHWWST